MKMSNNWKHEHIHGVKSRKYVETTHIPNCTCSYENRNGPPLNQSKYNWVLANFLLKKKLLNER
jgi:hypothetical protein